MASGTKVSLPYMVFRTSPAATFSSVKMLNNVSLSDSTDKIRDLISNIEILDVNFVNLWIVRFYGILC